ncbi:MAG: hypothetical protein QM831_31895 [Kofleriaceae bacterium]
MRRSLAVRLTLLPMLATAAVAYADPPLNPPSGPVEEAPVPETEMVLTPPSLTPPLDCADDPNADEREDCYETGVTISGGIVRGGFGHYFWVSGG